MSVQIDQGRLGSFRALLLVQAAVAGLFGLSTFLAPERFAAFTGYTGHQPFFYRLVGAATLGYGVVALAAYWERVPWQQVRIPIVAAFTFNLAAVVASLLSLADGDRQPLVYFVLVAAAAFTVVAAYWLRRNQGIPLAENRRISSNFRAVILMATAAAAFFGVVPLLLARPLASAAGFKTDDLFILRGAAAATLGYAVAGVLQLRSSVWSAIRLQVIAALVFNGLSVIGAALYLLSGGRSLVGWLILVAATIFTVGLAWGFGAVRAAGTPV
ncbi:MAG TPA: hypothetical protein VGR77_11795 [Candidatus Dormibacteraeota bacterium]|nr:hypothetical protein [Candidatus Dormibacteraeota bacterium]